MATPRHIQRFATALRGVRIDRLELPATKPTVEGIRGVLTTTRMQYVDQSWQLLGRTHEYTFWLPGPQIVEVSLQLYENVDHHWRLYAYCPRGMLFSVNLSTGRRDSRHIVLAQRLKLATRGMSTDARAEAMGHLRLLARNIGYEVDDAGDVTLGTFDGRAGAFLDTSPKVFVRDFVLLSAMKGHFMANKGYQLPGLRAPASVRRSAVGGAGRSIPAGLRYQVLEAAKQRCVLCGRSVADGIRLHVDHKTPWSQGGRTVFENLRALCDRCNLGKGSRHYNIKGTRPRGLSTGRSTRKS
ncbi:MAG: HNH endonuclease signature motif containing protein [Sandaracinus sp.]